MVAILGCTVVALELTGHGDDLPPMFQYVLWLGLTQVNSFIGLGYTVEDRLGQEVHIQLPALPIKDPRELALGSFFAGERLRSDHNLTVFDLGCGNCSVVAALKQRVWGVNFVGVAGAGSIPALGSNYRQGNLEEFIPLDADFIVSYEAGEHLHPKHEDAFLHTLAQAKRGLVLAWARPGQTGSGHHNERSQRHLISQIEAMSKLRYCSRVSWHLVKDFSVDLERISVYGNTMVFFHEGVGHDPYRCEITTFWGYALLMGLAMSIPGAFLAAYELLGHYLDLDKFQRRGLLMVMMIGVLSFLSTMVALASV